MNRTPVRKLELDTSHSESQLLAISVSVVNRTHRVVRQRAKQMRAQRRQARELWLPLLVCSGLLALMCFAAWSVVDQYDPAPSGIPDASQQLLVFMLWSLPLSAGLLASVWFRKNDVRCREDAEQS